MRVKSLTAGLIVTTATMFAAIGSVQAACSCYMHTPGWHMVPKSCDIRSAQTWQEYNSGIYTPPQSGTGKSILFLN
ncbi:MAG: hypothetical protein QM652_02100 [Legionella sp.]|uniref:hypothetical protein n=1 Tax=Legionella sp. TaxID=459 RepID=UPI0039E62B58